MNSDQGYDYSQAGFDGFLSRSIDDTSQTSLDSGGPITRQVSFDRGQVSGAFPDVVRIGNVNIDGINGRISVYDGENEVMRIGELGD